MDEEVDLKKKFWNVKTFVSFLIALIILYMLFSRVDIGRTAKLIAGVNPLLYILAFAIYYLSYPARGLRWKIFLENAGFQKKWSDITEVLFLSWFANCLVPAKLGDVYRGYLLKRNYNFSASMALGTIYVERMFDFILLISLLVLSGLVAFGDKIPGDIVFAIEIAIMLAILLLIGWFLIIQRSISIARFFPPRARDLFLRFQDGLSHSVSPATISAILAYTVFIWLVESARLVLVTRAIGIEVSIAMIAFVALSASLLTSLPITPAGLGAVELAMVALLGLSGVDATTAMSIALLDRFISYWSILIFGALLYIKSKKTQ